MRDNLSTLNFLAMFPKVFFFKMWHDVNIQNVFCCAYKIQNESMHNVKTNF